MRRTPRIPLSTPLLALLLLAGPPLRAQPVVNGAAPAAQPGARLIDRSRLDTPRPLPDARSDAAALPSRPAAAALPPQAGRVIQLDSVRLEGNAALTTAELAPAWANQVGRRVKVADIYAIADRIGAAYARRGLALYQVRVPPQPFNGPATISVTEGHVDGVTIEGDTAGADLSLLRAYAARIVAARPLLQSTLERYVLLMNDIAGLQVGSRFAPVPGRPGAVTLALTIARKRIEYGAGVNNQGQALLSRTSIDANIAANSVFREGDRTQLVFGAPLGFERYQFYGGVHRQPIGTDGATLQFTAGYLVTQPGGTRISGNAVTASVRLSYPIIRAVKESLVVSGAFDWLNSDNAALGNTLSDERTRAVRTSLTWARRDDWEGTTAAGATASFGVDALGARRSNIAAGGPSFQKITLSLSREQDLPFSLVMRLSAVGQIASQHLPFSEQFSYGGALFGRGFDAGAVLGDQGVAASAELAYKLPARWQPPRTGSAEAFGFIDYGRVYATRTLYQYPTDHGSSAGLGLRTKLMDKVTVEVLGARVLHRPLQVPGDEGWRFVLGVRGQF